MKAIYVIMIVALVLILGCAKDVVEEPATEEPVDEVSDIVEEEASPSDEDTAEEDVAETARLAAQAKANKEMLKKD